MADNTSNPLTPQGGGVAGLNPHFFESKPAELDQMIADQKTLKSGHKNFLHEAAGAIVVKFNEPNKMSIK
jgi:hypothetical protein